MSNMKYADDLRKENEELRDKLKASNNLLLFYMNRLRAAEAQLAQIVPGDSQKTGDK